MGHRQVYIALASAGVLDRSAASSQLAARDLEREMPAYAPAIGSTRLTHLRVVGIRSLIQMAKRTAMQRLLSVMGAL